MQLEMKAVITLKWHRSLYHTSSEILARLVGTSFAYCFDAMRCGRGVHGRDG
jgi:hypothetical protein